MFQHTQTDSYNKTLQRSVCDLRAAVWECVDNLQSAVRSLHITDKDEYSASRHSWVSSPPSMVSWSWVMGLTNGWALGLDPPARSPGEHSSVSWRLRRQWQSSWGPAQSLKSQTHSSGTVHTPACTHADAIRWFVAESHSAVEEELRRAVCLLSCCEQEQMLHAIKTFALGLLDTSSYSSSTVRVM